VVRAFSATAAAAALWLALTRLPFEGALVFAATAALTGTIAGDLIAVAVGWFAFLTDGWLVFPAIAAASAALASGVARAFAYRWSGRGSPTSQRV
jgi:hypothetical protein